MMNGIENQEAVATALEQSVTAEERRRTVMGVGLGGLAVAGAATVAWAAANNPSWRFTYPLPFMETAQDVVNNVDSALVPVGQVGLPLTLAAIAAAKVGARWSGRLRFADRFSSREPSVESGGHEQSRIGRVMRRVGLAMAGGALATFTAGVATEVTEGPSRPIDALDAVAAGEVMVVQNEEAMPMVQSNVNDRLTERFVAEASERGIEVTVIDLFLGTANRNGDIRTALVAGVDAPSESPVNWEADMSCTAIPAIVDTAAGIPVGERFTMNNITVDVVGTSEGASAMNRISVLTDREAMATCLRQDPEAPPHAVVLDTDEATAEAIVDAANEDIGAPVAVISKEDYKQNSEDFWESNVKPITNVLSLAAGGFALLAMSGAMASRILRNRRPLAVKLASGGSAAVLRTAEMLRAAKDGVIASVGGVLLGSVGTAGANALESGFRAGVGYRESMIGVSLALLGTMAGSALSLVGLKKTANPSENTRV